MKVNRLLINGTIVNSVGKFKAAIGIVEGKIACISENTSEIEADEIIDVEGKYILPGVIDAHIHFQDPGFTHREDFEHGTAACAVGGITTAMSHPMNDPAILDTESYNINVAAYEGRGIVDYGVHGGGTSNNCERIEDLWLNTGATSIKMFMCFSVKEFPFVQDDSMFDILQRLNKIDGLAIIHCENDQLIRLMEQRLKAEGRKDPMAYNESRPEIVEIEAIKRAIYLVEQANCKALIVHVSTAEGLEEIKKAQDRGVQIWAETCPHFLTFVREDMNEHGPYLKFSPVMRGEENRKRMWEFFDKGFVNTVGSDHCPYEKSEKETAIDDIWKAPNGIPGLEVMLPVFLNGVNAGLTSLERVVEVTSYNPSRIYGIAPEKGLIQIGSDADLVIVDMELEKTFTDADRKAKCTWSPYFGRKFKGWPTMTIVRGEIVAKDGQIMVNPGYGKYIPRKK